MSQLALITFLSGNQAVDPGYGQGIPVGGRPDNSLPGLPPNSVTLPVFPFDPTIDNSLPGSGGSIDNSLPSGNNRPSNELPTPGRKYVVKWLACVGLILVPDNELPPTAEPK